MGSFPETYIDPMFLSIVEPRFNRPLFNQNLNITNGILCPSNSKLMTKNLDIMNPQFNERIWLVPSDFIKSRFHCCHQQLEE